MAHRLVTGLLVLLSCALPTVAQDPEEQEEYDVKAAAKKVAELMGQTELRLVDSIAPDSIAPGDREAAEEAAKAAAAGGEAAALIERLLQGAHASGLETVAKLTELLENAPT